MSLSPRCLKLSSDENLHVCNGLQIRTHEDDRDALIREHQVFAHFGHVRPCVVRVGIAEAAETQRIPGIEFQNRKGMKAASVVAVEATTGQNMRFPAMP